uniref:Uncharacterized protein n=1 Tax=Quercus lobata TaxID=97700 RepID=A0A7N2M0I0_QUELO
MIKSRMLAVDFGANPVSLKKGMDKTERIGQGLEEENIAAVAKISSGNNEFVGNLIAEALEKIVPDGVISIESSSSFETSVIIELGMKVGH